MATATAAADAGAGTDSLLPTITVAGYRTCSYYCKAKAALLGMAALDDKFRVEVVECEGRDEFRTWWFARRDALGPRATEHSTSPAVWLGKDDFLGGCDATLAWLKKNFMAGISLARPPRVTHDSDVGPADGYDYDLIVIGGGSGGLACSKEASKLGAKVMVLDFVKPSWQGTTWGLGGTCVNVGCIPKKLMHQAALLGFNLTDAKAFGWKVPVREEATHDWSTMVTNVQDHIASLNFGYRVSLREAGVKYENALGKFVDAHTIEATNKRGVTTRYTARRFVIAVGGRPKPLEVPGGELALSSDDLFSLTKSPGKTLVVGASYVALECAGFLRGLGLDTTVMVRSILLRGFDQQCAEAIGTHMEHEGVKFIKTSIPKSIVKQDDGKLLVTFTDATGADDTILVDTVFVATGRGADTAKLGLEAAGVKTQSDGKIRAPTEQTNVPHIYAIGDVLAGRPELTPVAIAAGRALARRLYGGSSEGMDYERIPTTVFTPLEYGCCGMSEEAAMDHFGKDNIEVYHSYFTPLEWTVVHERPTDVCYAKLIVNKTDSERIVGFHILGPNAGEVTQGWACAVRMGATYASFKETVGIHPTVAEELTTLTVTKSSGSGAAKGGC